MSNVDTTRQFLKKYYEIEKFGKNISYQLYQNIVTQEQSVYAYMQAMAIPLVSALNIICKLITDLCCIIHTVIQSIAEHRYSAGNIFTLLANASEYCRSLLGCIFGIPITLLFSPRYAANTFLTPGSDISQTFLSAKESALLYAMADRLHVFFKAYKIDYRMCCGSALGAQREHGIIRNDDDIDLMIHPKSVELFTQLVNDGTFSRKTGISIQKQNITGGWQCFYEESPKGGAGTPLENIGFPFVDIFPGVYRKYKNDWIITYGENKMHYQSPGDYFTEQEWGKPVLYRFGPTHLYGIQSIKTYLQRCYGPLATEYVSSLYPHEVYSTIFGHPHRVFTMLFQYSTPRYFKHTHPNPHSYDPEAFKIKTALGKISQPLVEGYLKPSHSACLT